MLPTQRQQASFDEAEEEEEEEEFYHRADLEDTMIMMENGLEAEGIGCAVTRLEKGMCKLKVSE